jgi:CheY-like chemotaxis protein
VSHGKVYYWNLYGELVDKKVLIVEDDRATRRLIELMLTRMGCDIRIAVNGLEAVEHAKKCTFDLILMDLSMPKMDGMEATTKLREAGYKSTIFALTGNNMCDLNELRLVADFDGIIFKTADKEEFQAEIEKILNK